MDSPSPGTMGGGLTWVASLYFILPFLRFAERISTAYYYEERCLRRLNSEIQKASELVSSMWERDGLTAWSEDVYVPGCNHSGLRPKFYESLGLWQGTINFQLPRGTDEPLILPNKRVPGLDPIDLSANQDFLVRPCRLKGGSGYQILPMIRRRAA